MEETLPILLQRLGIKEKRAILTLPGRAAFTRRLQVPMVRGRQLEKIINYEARQHIPFPLDQVNLDYQINPPGENAVELDVNLVAIRKEIADSYVAILKKCGIRADILETAPLSIFNAYAASSLRDTNEVTAVICIGSSNTDIVIEQNGFMQFMRTAPVAGNNLTAMLMKRYDLSLEKAEEYKTKPADQYGADTEINADDVASILEKGFESIVTEIRRSFDFYVSQPDANPVTRVVVCGGTAKMDGVAEFLEDRIGVPVSLFDASLVDCIQIPPDHSQFLSYEAPLIGMCVRTADKSACALSFSPVEIKQSIELERRSPMLGIMAILIVLIMVCAIFLIQNMINTQSEAVRQVNTIINPTSEKAPQLKILRDAQKEYLNRFQKINLISDKRGKTTRIFLEIQSLIPSGVWIKKIDQFSNKVKIKGSATGEDRVYAYIQALSMSPFFSNDSIGLSEISAGQFTIDILQFNTPSDEEIKFVEELRKQVKDFSFLMVRFDHAASAETKPGADKANLVKTDAPKTDDSKSDVTLVLGIYQIEADKDRLILLNKIFTALNMSKDESIKKIEIREHDRAANEVRRFQVDRQKISDKRDGKLGDEEFLQSFAMLTPSPSPVPSPTPMPEQGSDGGMYGGMGIMGGGGEAAAAPAAGDAAGAAGAGAAGADGIGG